MEFNRLLSTISAQKLLLILDCCHASGSADFKAQSGQTLWKSGLSEDYYEALIAGSGRVIIASSKENEFSYVREQGDLSLFTYHLCAALKGQASVRGDGSIHVLDVYDYTNRTVHSDQPQQTPILKVQDMDLNFAIALDRGGRKTASSASFVTEVAEASSDGWNSAERITEFIDDL
jgi:uncharacterized caspase-like protein